MSESTSIKLSDGMRDRLRSLADQSDRSVNQIMNEAIDVYVQREERRAAFLAEAETRWIHYKETGLHISQEEAEEWIDRLLLGNEPTVPDEHK